MPTSGVITELYPTLGAQIRAFVTTEERLVALLGVGASTRFTAPRLLHRVDPAATTRSAPSDREQRPFLDSPVGARPEDPRMHRAAVAL